MLQVVLHEAVAALPEGSNLVLGPELVLPREGIIVFPKSDSGDAATQLTLLTEERARREKGSSDIEACRNGGGVATGDAVFRSGSFRQWHDPANWKGYSAATPHLRRIPCRY